MPNGLVCHVDRFCILNCIIISLVFSIQKMYPINVQRNNQDDCDKFVFDSRYRESDQSDSGEELDDSIQIEWTILEAAEKGKLEMVQNMVQQNPSLVNIKDVDGYTALHRACYNNCIEVVKYLIENGANVCARTIDGWQPIHSASQWGNVEIVRILLSAGADINSRSNGGNTPFHLTVTRPKNRSLIEYLLFRDDVEIDAKNDAGDTPFDICKRNSKLYKLWQLL